MPLLEICVESPTAVATAVAGGADRIELCAALALGGLTPSAGLIALAVATNLPVMTMIRPVAGSFAYDAATLAAMANDIDQVAAQGVAGIVFGALAGAALDLHALGMLMDHARRAGERRGRPLATTLHRAIDLCADPLTAVDAAIAIGFDNILSSGGAATAAEGAPMLATMVARAAGRCTIIAGAGIDPNNAAGLIATSRVSAVHASCTVAASTTPATTFDFIDPIRPIDLDRVKALRAAIDRPLDDQ